MNTRLKLGPHAAVAAILSVGLLLVAANRISACTGITLKAKDGAVVFGRTMEWGSFDLNSRLAIVPRGYAFKSHLEGEKIGFTWKSLYGAAGIDAVEKDLIIDGMNEKGLSVNVFYHPGFAEYAKPDPAELTKTIGSLDVCQYLLTTCTSVAEVRAALSSVKVVGVVEPALGIAPPIHLIATEPSGAAVVIEFTKDGPKSFDTPLGVITNANIRLASHQPAQLRQYVASGAS